MTTLSEATLPELLTAALSKADGGMKRRYRGKEETALAESAVRLAPGVRLYASQARDGKWWYYLVLPRNQRPRKERGWMFNESGGYFWQTGTGTSEDNALANGMVAYFTDLATPTEETS